jgi:Domain of unknown function (DUF4145)
MKLHLRADGQSAPGGHTPISLRCPICHTQSTLDPLGPGDFQVQPSGVYLAIRRCPVSDCHALIFVVWQPGPTTPIVVASFPAELLDFDATNIPAKVTEAMEEAIQCHANQCFIAAAIMVRKTLEELCADQGAEGDNLKQRIKALGSKVVLPKELLEGLDDLRLLGNDAAHIESREYDKVGKEEVEIGIEFAKEVLKATYQYSHLLARLRELKASTSQP